MNQSTNTSINQRAGKELEYILKIRAEKMIIFEMALI